ncbi:MAG: peptidylprolyl isomerase [Betaproteobacteria bacterium]|nr:peptidylprolyl isomerase [Betaproteobacteria bacterium]
MKRQVIALALLLPCLAFAQLPTKEPAKAPAKPAATGPLATVNGVQIPRQRLEVVLQQQVARGASDSEPLRAQVREALINNELLIQEANRSGIAKKAEVLQQLDITRQEVIANAVVTEHLRVNPVSDADIQKEYDRARSQTGDREFKARHILVATEDDAKSVLADLKKGGKFDDISQKRSLDEGTRPRGGDLDWNVPRNFDKAFADAMLKLEKGEMTEAPVRSRFGFHVIQLDDVRPVNFPPLAQVKQQIQQRLVGQKIDGYIRDLRANSKIE